MTIPAAPAGPSVPASGWTTLFSDDFLGTSLNTTFWFPGAVYDGTSPNTRGFTTNGTPPTPGGEFQLYTPANVTVAGSICTLTAKAQVISGDPVVGGVQTSYNYTSGCISTQPNTPNSSTPGFVFNPGTRTVISASVKIPSPGTGIWPAWWASSQGTYLYEIDVFELYNSSTVPQSNIHYRYAGSTSANAQSGPFVPSPFSDLSTTYHIYTADINTDGHGTVTFYIDGTPVHSFQEAGYNVNMLLLFDLALNNASPTNLPATMNIDWVAVYQPEAVVPTITQTPTLDTGGHIAAGSRDDVSAVFTSGQTASTLVNGRMHIYNLTSASVTQTLPAVPLNGTTLGLKRIDSANLNTLTIAAGGSDTIEQGAFALASIGLGIGRSVVLTYETGVWTATVGMLTTTGVTTITDQRYRSSYGPNVCEFHVNDYAGADPTGAASSDAAVISAIGAASNAISNGALEAYVVHGVGTYKETVGNMTTTTSAIGVTGPGESACTINVQGNGAAWLVRNQTSNWATVGGSLQTFGAAKVGGFTLDGTACGTSTWAAGILDIDVMRAWYEDIWGQNFAGPIGSGNAASGRSAALWQYCANYWSERTVGRRMTFINNTISHLQDGGTSTFTTGQSGGGAGVAGPASFDYSFFSEISFQIRPGQIGRYVINSANVSGGNYECVANAKLSSGAASYLWAIGVIGATGDNSNVINAVVNVAGETDGSGSAAYDLNVSAISGLICHGVWNLQSGGTAWSSPSGMVFADAVMSGMVSTPSMARPIYTATGLSSAVTGKAGLWTCNQSTRYGMQLPASQGTAPVVGITYYSGTGVPTFTPNAIGDIYRRIDGLTTGTRSYQYTATSTWTATGE